MPSPADKTLKRRSEYVDCMKGVAILSIMFLHYEDGVIPGWLNAWIGLFMITAFYISSGWIFGLKGGADAPKELWRKRIRQLGIPYLWFAVLIIAFDILWSALGFMDPRLILREVYKWVTLRGIGTLWFLPVLLFGEMLFCFVMSSRRPRVTGAILFILTLVATYLYYDVWDARYRNLSETFQLIDSPIRPVAMSLGAWPLIWVGYFLSRKYSGYFTSGHKWHLALIGSAVLVVSMWLVVAPPFRLFYINNFLSNSLPAVGMMCVFVLVGHTAFGRFFSYWGRNSLVMMCLHFSILYEICLTIDKYVFHHDHFTGWNTVVYFIVSVLVMYPLVTLFEGKLSFMLGRQKKSKS